MTTHACYRNALTRRETFRKSPDGWCYCGSFRFSCASSTILIDTPTDADTVARAVVAFERADGGEMHPITDHDILRVIDARQAVLHIGRRDVLIRIA